jgi:hypothetical protein
VVSSCRGLLSLVRGSIWALESILPRPSNLAPKWFHAKIVHVLEYIKCLHHVVWVPSHVPLTYILSFQIYGSLWIHGKNADAFMHKGLYKLKESCLHYGTIKLIRNLQFRFKKTHLDQRCSLYNKLNFIQLQSIIWGEAHFGRLGIWAVQVISSIVDEGTSIKSKSKVWVDSFQLQC